MWCHLLLFGLPVLALPLFWMFPLPLALALYVPLSAISVWLGAVVLRALRMPVSTGAGALLGRSGRVVIVDRQGALVQLDEDGELWRASAPGPLSAKQVVDVLDVDGLTLIVAPHPSGSGVPRSTATSAGRDGSDEPRADD